MKKTLQIATAVALAALPLMVGAQSVNIANLPTNISNVNVLLGKVCSIINLLFTILLIVAVIFIILAAFTYLTAGGDPEKVKKASSQVLYAVVAVVVATFAKIIPIVASNFIGSGITSIGC